MGNDTSLSPPPDVVVDHLRSDRDQWKQLAKSAILFNLFVGRVLIPISVAFWVTR